MARGPVPKAPGTKAGHMKDTHQQRVVNLIPVSSQSIPMDILDPDETWHPATLRWWSTWAASPLTDTWSSVDWEEFAAVAVIHHQFFCKRTFTLAGELRLRMATFGATPADRARLRIVTADADQKDTQRPVAPAKERRTLHALAPVAEMKR